ncbi:hypothetical protein RHGRI_016079 [Rhododendron griersonianum]|uniref:Jacalin-type lectin domain-containing protein n=1 Tax=Rhododendron griersonianum TaxID=479676 RepID=A0AAV6JS87_9ERIC|nr:hypothetical protein RHGRI_016079 [Rhododendron griersonianum]
MGPWGGQQGEAWAYKPNGSITEIIVRHGGVIDSLLFKSESCDGFPLEPSQKFGGCGGNRTDKFWLFCVHFGTFEINPDSTVLAQVCIDGVEEYLTTISMTFGGFDGVSVIKSLSFHTNLTAEYGPFGSKSGTSVSIPMEGGVIFGFHGRAGKYLNAIGVYVAPKSTSSCQIGSQLSAPTPPKTPSSMNLPVQRDSGPWGAQRGRHWDDGVFLAIKRVILRTGSEYGHTIKMNSAGEIIVGIEGFYGPAKGTDGFECFHLPNLVSSIWKMVKLVALQVKMSREEDGCITIGPWGGQEGEPWSYKTDGRITQIIVRHGWAVDSILFQSQSCSCLTPECSEKFGGSAGRTDKICIDSAVEQLKTISMTWGEFEGEHAIRSLCFHTNLTEYGPYGLKDQGTSVTIPMEGGVVVGFHGRAGRLLNAIGVYNMMRSMELFVPRDPGPWGASGGKHWDDGVFSAIKKVHLNVVMELPGCSAIRAVRFQYEKADGKCFQSPCHGGNGFPTIELDSPSEVIVGIEGFYGPLMEWKNGFEALTSITFHTNKQTYGPYGRLPSDSLKQFLKQIMVRLPGMAIIAGIVAKASSLEGCISIGPWGHPEGKPWVYNPEGRIRQITVCNGSVVDSLYFQSESSNGVVWSEKYGGPGGSRSETVNITSPAEYLTALDITFGNFKGQDVVTSICFRTNVRQYGPFGNKKGYSLSIPLEGGAIVGFHGHAGQYLNAIGIYAKPQSTSGEEYEATQTQITDIMKLAVPRDTGPWGGSGGKHWDDGVFATVKQVEVHIEQALNVIRAVQLRCEKRDGQLVVTPSHGGPRGDMIKTFKVDGTSEFLVSIEGFYGPVEGKNDCEAIKCITFYSNKRRYGPYGGEEIGTHFSSAQSAGKIVGFFGRAGSYLNAIGVHMEYF